MKLDDLASLMKITKDELIEQLKQNDILELKLIENNKKVPKETGTIEILQ